MGFIDKFKEQVKQRMNGMGMTQNNNYLDQTENNEDRPMPPTPVPQQSQMPEQPMAPMAPPPLSKDTLYGQYMDNLIEMALADGILTEKEKQVLFKKAQSMGIDLDEFEMVLEAKLFEKQKNKKNSLSADKEVAPKSNKYGDVRKCPSCGAIVETFSVKCPDCGYEFHNVETVSSVQSLVDKLEALDRERKNSFSSSITSMFTTQLGVNPIVKKKQLVIESFIIPTTKEDILEFLVMAVPLARKSGMFAQEDIETKTLRPIWKKKCEQVIIKARLAMADDKQTMSKIEEYAKQLKIK